MLNDELDRLIFYVLWTRMKPDRSINSVISSSMISELISTSKEIFKDEPMMLRLDFPIVIVGDIHGNIDDLIRIFERNGYPPDSKYLFLGDYVDRGPCSIEVMILLLSLKCKYPNHINLLRGNHETASISKVYGFSTECENKYKNCNLFPLFTSMFNTLPIAALLDAYVFCVHGGISQRLSYIDVFESIPKPREIYNDTVFSDLLWSDPKRYIENFQINSRGCGCYFSQKNLVQFLDRNKLQMLIRSHEERQYGYEWDFEKKICLTVFSNSDYCGHGNIGATISISKDMVMNKELFKPLSKEEKEKRQILFPTWLLTKLDIVAPSYEPISYSQPETEDIISVPVDVTISIP